MDDRAGPEGDRIPVEARRVGDELVVTMQCPSCDVNPCDGFARFTVDDVSVRAASRRRSRVHRRARRRVRSTNASNEYPTRTGKRYGSGAFCLWAAESGYDRSYEVTAQAWDDAPHVTYRGVRWLRGAHLPRTTVWSGFAAHRRRRAEMIQGHRG